MPNNSPEPPPNDAMYSAFAVDRNGGAASAFLSLDDMPSMSKLPIISALLTVILVGCGQGYVKQTDRFAAQVRSIGGIS